MATDDDGADDLFLLAASIACFLASILMHASCGHAIAINHPRLYTGYDPLEVGVMKSTL